jgi:formylaminopyrimidine deformylase / aminopyrimidine aminohydrolase
VPAADLLDRHPAAWSAATGHRFLDAVRDGSLPDAALDIWLAQDFLFVCDLLAFQSRLVGRAPETARGPLLAGAAALVEELVWFGRQAAVRDLRLPVAPLPQTRAYAALLTRLDAAPYAEAVVALWVLERVYLDAWAGVAPGTGRHRAFVEHWTAPGFAGYVGELERLADVALTEVADVDALVLDVLRQEAAFWDMAVDGVGA